MKLKELASKIKNEDEYRIVCKCGREGDLELCGDYEVESLEIENGLIIKINKSLSEIHAYKAIQNLSSVLVYSSDLRIEQKNQFHKCIEKLKEVVLND